MHPELSRVLAIAGRYPLTTLISTNGQTLDRPAVQRALQENPSTYLIVAVDGLTDQTNAVYRKGAPWPPRWRAFRVAGAFRADSALDALIGSYDDAPACRDLVSSYKNLQHCFIHQRGRRQANTFWAGCGAMRRTVFLEHGGFNETYPRPTIEDIELGYRLVHSGRKIILDPELQVKHLKRWTLVSLIRTDVLDRGIPWTELILRDHRMPDDLNLKWSQRASVALAFCLAGAPILGPLAHVPLGVLTAGWAGLLLATVAMNSPFYRFLAAKRGWRFSLAAIPLHVLYHFYSGVAFLAGAARHGWRSIAARGR